MRVIWGLWSTGLWDRVTCDDLTLLLRFCVKIALCEWCTRVTDAVGAQKFSAAIWHGDFVGQVHAICDAFKRVPGVHREFARRCPISHRYSYVSIERRPCGRATWRAGERGRDRVVMALEPMLTRNFRVNRIRMLDWKGARPGGQKMHRIHIL